MPLNSTLAAPLPQRRGAEAQWEAPAISDLSNEHGDFASIGED